MTEPTVLARHDDLVAVSKPHGWVVHAAMPNEAFDVQEWCVRTLGAGFAPCHRLDRDTSGVALYAARPETRARVGKAFEAGAVEKEYLALVFGRAHAKGVIREPLAPDDGGAPQDAVTRYRVEELLGGFALLRVRPETGRKHQIRRHLAHVHLPVVGDPRHRPSRPVRVPAWPGRMFLHATRIGLPAGVVSDAPFVVECPLPPELLRCLEAIRAGTLSARRA